MFEKDENDFSGTDRCFLNNCDWCSQNRICINTTTFWGEMRNIFEEDENGIGGCDWIEEFEEDECDETGTDWDDF